MRKSILLCLVFTLALAGKVIASDNLDEDVFYSTIGIATTDGILIHAGDCVFDGIICASVAVAAAAPYVIIRDTPTNVTAADTGREVFRVYLTTTASLSAGGAYTMDSTGMYNFTYKPIYPMRMRLGLAANLSVATFTKPVVILWRRIKSYQ